MSSLPAVELYAIGTELLMGQIQDSNSFWMSQQIAAQGGHIRRIVILDDEIDEIGTVLQDAIDRKTRVIITTGGLGPTPDDLTVEAIAKLKGVDVIVNESLIEAHMKVRNIERREDVNPGLVKMATSPEGSTVHPNPAGVAPCVETQIGDTTIFNLPGPPREVQALFAQSIESAVAELYTGNRVLLRVVVNLPESTVGPIIHKVMQNHPDTYVKSYVSLREKTDDGQRLPVDIVARGEDEAAAQTLLNNALETFTALVAEEGRTVEILND